MQFIIPEQSFLAKDNGEVLSSHSSPCAQNGQEKETKTEIGRC
jgi:hypothetical protein